MSGTEAVKTAVKTIPETREALVAIIDWQRRALAERDAEILRLREQIAAMTASHRGA